jgi:hypothetical protein
MKKLIREHVCMGKIARLPYVIREEVNCRLRDGQTAPVILTWLNALPTVQKILADQFAGTLITSQNLSNWRAIGFQRWLKEQEPTDNEALFDSDLEELDEQMRIAAAFYLRVLGDKQAKLIGAAPIPDLEKLEQMGRHLFGENWVPLSDSLEIKENSISHP